MKSLPVLLKYVNLSKKMPSLIESAGDILAESSKIIHDIYSDGATDKMKSYLDNENHKVQSYSKILKNTSLKHSIIKNVVEQYPEIKETVLSDDIGSNDLFNIPVIALLTGLSGDVISKTETLTYNIRKQNSILKKVASGDIREYDLSGISEISPVKTQVNLPVAFGIGSAIFAGFYFLRSR